MMMALLLSAASVVMPSQQHAVAGALYKIVVRMGASGLFERTASDGTTIQQSFGVGDAVSEGSAVMIEPDGWLLTARHVVDPAYKMGETCQRIARQWDIRSYVTRVELLYSITDVIGTVYEYRVAIVPIVEGSDLCDPATEWQDMLAAVERSRPVAIDSLADVALLKLEVRNALAVPLAPAMPARWSAVFAQGYVDAHVQESHTGNVARTCEDQEGECTTDDQGKERCPTVRVMRTTVEVFPGMSGGPVIHGNEMVGLTVMKSLSYPISFAIPSTYLRAWIDAVRRPNRYRMPTQVCSLTGE